MTPSPHAPGFDLTRSFLRAPYLFIGNTCARLGSDIFETRLFRQRTICLRGEEASALFADDSRFERRPPRPEGLLRRILGDHRPELDGPRRLIAKTIRQSLFETTSLAYARRLLADEWSAAAPWWALQGKAVLYDEVQTILTRVACAWTGVPLAEADVCQCTSDLALLFDPLAREHDAEVRRARRRVEAWLGGAIRAGRAEGAVEPNSALERLVRSKVDEAGAAAELCSVLEPVVALSASVVFLALALHQYPHLVPTTSEERRAFVQEVRRFYPCMPVAVAQVRRDFEWRGISLRAGQRALLDLYGTNHHPATWSTPSEFQPDRFEAAPPRSHARLAGGPERGPLARCGEEELGLSLLDEALLQLTVFMQYRVYPEQDLRLEMRRVPALPFSHLILDEVQARPFVDSAGRQEREDSTTSSRGRTTAAG